MFKDVDESEALRLRQCSLYTSMLGPMIPTVQYQLEPQSLYVETDCIARYADSSGEVIQMTVY